MKLIVVIPRLSLFRLAGGLLTVGALVIGLGPACVHDSGGGTPPEGSEAATAPGSTATSGPTETPLPATTATQTPRPAPSPTAIATPSSTAAPAPTAIWPRPTATAAPTPTPDQWARFTKGWKTDFSIHSVPYSDILSGGIPKDGIQPIYFPNHIAIEQADEWLNAQEPVIYLEIGGLARAYPLQILVWHEIVNDVLDGVPVAVTFCPLCNSAIVFDRRLDGVVHDFGVSGNLRNSDLIMWDHQTESWWQQLTGNAIVGELTGKQLTFIPALIISWTDFKTANPEGTVLSRDNGLDGFYLYGVNPYPGYDRVDSPPFLFFDDTDPRLLPMERVAAVTIGGISVAFPFSVLETERVVNHTIGGQDIVVFFKPGTLSALDNSYISDSRDVGATGVFDPNLNSRKLTFRSDGDNMVDNETGSQWNILGQATQGPLKGSRLNPVIHANHFWFAWGAFKPDTKIYRGAE